MLRSTPRTHPRIRLRTWQFSIPSGPSRCLVDPWYRRFHGVPIGGGSPGCHLALSRTALAWCTQTLTTPRRFLLKYASRDEVDLLGRGNGGIPEIQNAIAEYEETSPLYGFLRYRRRNVLIKYLPEDCSRLIQGRRYCAAFWLYPSFKHLPWALKVPVARGESRMDNGLTHAL